MLLKHPLAVYSVGSLGAGFVSALGGWLGVVEHPVSSVNTMRIAAERSVMSASLR
jgi:hypothetical protein